MMRLIVHLHLKWNKKYVIVLQIFHLVILLKPKSIFREKLLLKKKKWYRIFDTSDNEGVKEELEDNQKIIELKERTIAVLIGK